MLRRDSSSSKRESTTAKRATQGISAPVEQPSFTEYPVTILTDTLQARGALHSFGVMQTFVNDDQKPTLQLFSTEMFGFDPGNPATRITAEEVFIRKQMCQLIAFEAVPTAGQIAVMPRTEMLAMYLDRFVIQGKFHMGPDDRLVDFTESSLQQFVVITEVHIFPLFQPRYAVIQQAPFAFIQRSRVNMYHKVNP
jgi:hypothetical protein